MLVYNLTSQQIIYRGKSIPPNGGYLEYPELVNVPSRDRRLEENKILAFGSKPLWWLIEEQQRASPQAKPPVIKPEVQEPKATPERESPIDARFCTEATPVYGVQSTVPPRMPVEDAAVEQQSKKEDIGFNPPDTQPPKGVFGKRHRR